MRGILKAAAVLAVIGLVLAAAGLAALRILFPPETLKALALSKAKEASGREVRLKKVGIGLRGLSLSGLEVSEAPDFAAGTFLKAGSARLSLRLRPLLQRRLEVGELLLADWECRIVKRKDGTYNFTTIGKPPARSGAGSRPRDKEHILSRGPWPTDRGQGAEPDRPGRPSVGESAPGAQTPRGGRDEAPGGAAPAPAFSSKAFLIASIQSRNGSLSYQDPASDTSVQVKGITLTARGLKASGPVPMSFSFSTSGRAGKTGLTGRTEFKGEADLGGLDFARASLRIDRLKSSIGEAGGELSGAVRGLAAPEVDLKFSGLKASPALPPVDGSLEGSYSGDTARIRRLAARLGQLKLQANGAIRGLGADPTAALDASLDPFPLQALGAFSPRVKDLKLTGRAEARVRVSGRLASPAVSGKAEIKDAALTASGQELRGIAGTLTFSPEEAAAGLSGRWGKGEFRFDIDAKDLRKAPDVKVTGTLSELDLNALAGARPADKAPTAAGSGVEAERPGRPSGGASAPGAKPPLKTSGKVSVGRITHPNFTAARAELRWGLTRALEPEKVSGTVAMQVEDGKFDNLKALADKKSIVRAALMPILIIQKVGSLAKIPLLPAFDRVRYKEIVGDYAFKDGLMTIKESHMDSDSAYVTATGAADLGRDELNLRVSARLAPNLGVRLGGPLSFTVRGSLSNPSVKPDVASLIKQPEVEKAIDEGRKLLKGLFK